MMLFFQGSPRIGKSTILRNTVNEHNLKIAAFTVQRIIENGATIGYQVTMAKDKLPPVDVEYNKNLDGIFLLNKQKKLHVLEKTILKTENYIKSNKIDLIVLDEIGGIELKSKDFINPLLNILNSNIPCVGIFKSRANLENAIEQLSLPEDYLLVHNKLESLIEEKGKLLNVSSKNIDIISTQTNFFIKPPSF